MIIVATDAPLDARDLERLAARAIFAMARTGSTYSNGSGDFAIAFSTHPSLRITNDNAPQPRTILPTDAVSGLFEAALDATEQNQVRAAQLLGISRNTLRERMKRMSPQAGTAQEPMAHPGVELAGKH